MRLISRRELNLAKFAGETFKQDTEYLCVEGNAAYATNGHYMLQALVKKDEQLKDFPHKVDRKADIKSDKYLICPATANKVLKNLPKNNSTTAPNTAIVSKTKKGLAITTMDQKNSVTITQGPTTVGVRKTQIDWKEYFPKKSEFLNEITINFRYLKMLMGALSEFKADNPAVKIAFSNRFGDEKLCLSLSVEDSDGALEVLLMPIQT